MVEKNSQVIDDEEQKGLIEIFSMTCKDDRGSVSDVSNVSDF